MWIALTPCQTYSKHSMLLASITLSLPYRFLASDKKKRETMKTFIDRLAKSKIEDQEPKP